MKIPVAPIFAVATLASGQSLAQSAAPVIDADTEVSKEIENPVTRRITLPLRYEADFLDGANKATKDIFEIDQAVVPFQLNEDWALITRTKLPVEALPPKKLGESLVGSDVRHLHQLGSVAGLSTRVSPSHSQTSVKCGLNVT